MPSDRHAVPPPRRRSAVYRIVTIVLGVLAGLGIGEYWLRTSKMLPPRQVVRGEGLTTVDGVPIWEPVTDRYNRECVEQHPERLRVLFFGSSITYGFDVKDVFTRALEARLNEVRPVPGFCVLNFAQPGFQFQQKLALAQREVPRYRPAVIMWEDWAEWHTYRVIGDAAYVTDDLAVRRDGFIGMQGVPDALNRFLFLHSRLYEYLTLAFGEPANRVGEPGGELPFYNTRLIKVVQLAQSVSAKLALYLAIPLDRSFAETAAAPPDWHRELLEFARAHDIPAYPLEHELIDQDYLALRLDPCCHFNAAGQQALVPIMERIVLAQLDGRP